MAETELGSSGDCGGTEADSVMMQVVDGNSQGEGEVEGEGEGDADYASDSNQHRCDSCDFEVGSRSELLAHLATGCSSDRRKIFQCDVCHMKFSNGANMRRHKMRHTGVKPYECRVCQKRFFRKDHLAEHFTTHTKTLPFHCPICNRGFQRQIAMRAHFQNEHVGGSELVKSCPLCTYRAGSMKSLRVHFYNRHGIDLDRPSNGSNGGQEANTTGGGGSDSGDSARSIDNATPPMHFLTPHVELSLPDQQQPPSAYSPTPTVDGMSMGGSDANGEGPGSPQSGDSNAPSSSNQSQGGGGLGDHQVTPSVSLIPIKQELLLESDSPSEKRPMASTTGGGGGGNNTPVNLTTRPHHHSALSSIIKVSPLKSLLREDGSGRNRCNKEASSSSEVDCGSAGLWRGGVSSSSPSCNAVVSSLVAARLACSFCGIAFPDQTLYFLHKGCHAESNPWKCNICGEQCINVYDFNSHLLSKTHQ